jgi:hypothetical protein
VKIDRQGMHLNRAAWEWHKGRLRKLLPMETDVALFAGLARNQRIASAKAVSRQAATIAVEPVIFYR